MDDRELGDVAPLEAVVVPERVGALGAALQGELRAVHQVGGLDARGVPRRALALLVVLADDEALDPGLVDEAVHHDGVVHLQNAHHGGQAHGQPVPRLDVVHPVGVHVRDEAREGRVGGLAKVSLGVLEAVLEHLLVGRVGHDEEVELLAYRRLHGVRILPLLDPNVLPQRSERRAAEAPRIRLDVPHEYPDEVRVDPELGRVRRIRPGAAPAALRVLHGPLGLLDLLPHARDFGLGLGHPLDRHLRLPLPLHQLRGGLLLLLLLGLERRQPLHHVEVRLVALLLRALLGLGDGAQQVRPLLGLEGHGLVDVVEGHRRVPDQRVRLPLGRGELLLLVLHSLQHPHQLRRAGIQLGPPLGGLGHRARRLLQLGLDLGKNLGELALQLRPAIRHLLLEELDGRPGGQLLELLHLGLHVDLPVGGVQLLLDRDVGGLVLLVLLPLVRHLVAHHPDLVLDEGKVVLDRLHHGALHEELVLGAVARTPPEELARVVLPQYRAGIVHIDGEVLQHGLDRPAPLLARAPRVGLEEVALLLPDLPLDHDAVPVDGGLVRVLPRVPDHHLDPRVHLAVLDHLVQAVRAPRGLGAHPQGHQQPR
mmetsp:Transcript_22259/g.69277  ORF Transcript_22259/g.69277 Transcript_22259/m.69277 type:complete len:594 (+) Transcript_22259:1785-3566(+)